METKNFGTEIQWLTEIEGHDYPAAQHYQLLAFANPHMDLIIARLKKAEQTLFKSKD